MKRERQLMSVTTAVFALLVTTIQVGRIDESNLPAPTTVSIFTWPKLARSAAELGQKLQAALQARDFTTAENISSEALAKLPRNVHALFYYHRAQARAAQGKNQPAMRDLQQAVKLGLRDARAIDSNPVFDGLRNDDAWPALLRDSRQPASESSRAPIRDGVAMVEEDNTKLASSDQFAISFVASEQQKAKAITLRDDAVGKLLKKWSADGTAVGLGEVLYDNHDRVHSDMNWREFPQLSRIKYSAAAKKAGIDNGFQAQCQFNMVTFGNSSTAMTSSHMWRSQPRLAYTNPLLMEIVAKRFSANHLYLYPEHKDHDPGHNRSPGYGDVFPANTPYFIISQGSSYSDKPFMTAVAATLSAFRPEVFDRLKKQGTIFHVVQMIFRRCLNTVKSDEDYLSGLAHPVVFNSGDLNLEQMVRMAHDIQANEVPPSVQLKIERDDLGVVGRDYFDIGDREVLFTTPMAIARSFRSTGFTKKIRVSGEGTDANGRPITYRWVVLQGDPDRIRVSPSNSDSSTVEIEIDYHERFRVQNTSAIESNRVDIGLFAYNGKYYSAPAIISYYFPDNEVRRYDSRKRIQQVVYNSNYVDPAFVAARNWVDDYSYNEQGRPTGWIRTIKGERRNQRYLASGQLVTQQDDSGKPLASTTVRYVAVPGGLQRGPILKIEIPSK